MWGGVTGDLGIVSVRAAIRPAIVGRTALEFPPLGSVAARTHMSPLLLDLRIDQVHIEQTAKWLKQRKSPRQTVDLVEAGIRRIAYRLAYLSVIIAAAGALFACLLFRVGRRHLLAGTLAGLLGVLIPLALAAATYNPGAFDTPQFQGEMSQGPHLLNVAQQAWQSNAGIIKDIPRIASRTVALCQRLEQAGYQGLNGSQPYCRVLLISDLHNNPVGVRFALDLAQTYQPKLVLIAGDFTDLGHPLEPELLAGLKKFDVPIVAVAGNHDSRATVRVLKTIPEMTVLDGQVVDKGGFSIIGFGDPSARRSGTGSVDTSPARLRALARRIGSRLHHAQPDILLVHNNDLARSVAGCAPVIADGHLHKASVRSQSGSVLVNPGTTGAAGVRYFSAKEKPSYTAAVLQFTLGSKPRLRKVDSIRMELPSGDFEVRRESVGSGR